VLAGRNPPRRVPEKPYIAPEEIGEEEENNDEGNRGR
jgi:hypothetical protein